MADLLIWGEGFAKLLLVHYHSTLNGFFRRILELIMVFVDQGPAIASNKGIDREFIRWHVYSFYRPTKLYLATWTTINASCVSEDLALAQEAPDTTTKQSWSLCFLTSLKLYVGFDWFSMRVGCLLGIKLTHLDCAAEDVVAAVWSELSLQLFTESCLNFLTVIAFVLILWEGCD